MVVLDQKRYERQELAVKKWIANNSKGAITATTGVGKTLIGIIAINSIVILRTTYIVVPTIVLKEQWESELSKAGITNVTVFVINTYIKESRICSLLICDEGHHISSEEAIQFNTVLDNTTYKAVLVMSATFTKPQLVFLASKGIQLVDTITEGEASRNNWISSNIQYNLVLDFLPEEQINYDSYSKTIKGNFPYFNHDLSTLYKVISDKKFRENYCKENSFDDKEIMLRALKITKCINSRKKLVYATEAKINVLFPLISKLKERKIIIFSETKEYAERVNKMIDNSVLYHSGMTDKKKEIALNSFKDDTSNVICTAKALNEGLNIPNLDCGIIASGTSSSIAAIQRLGRICRYIEDKTAIMINLYMRDSIELSWLTKRQKGMNNIRWVDKIDDIAC